MCSALSASSPKAVKLSERISAVRARSVPPAAARSNIGPIPAKICFSFQPAIAKYVIASADCVAVKRVDAPSSSAFALNLSYSSGVAFAMARTFDMVASKLIAVLTAPASGDSAASVMPTLVTNAACADAKFAEAVSFADIAVLNLCCCASTCRSSPDNRPRCPLYASMLIPAFRAACDTRATSARYFALLMFPFSYSRVSHPSRSPCLLIAAWLSFHWAFN